MVRIYRAPWSTNVERVTLALGHKGVEHEDVWIEYSDRSAVEAVSGQPLIPVVVFSEEVVHDSSRILRRLEELYPEPPLFPSDPTRAAEMDIFIEWFNAVWKRPPNEIERILGLPETDPAHIAELSRLMDEWLDVFESMLTGRDFLFGESFSAADCIAYPFLKYAAGRDPSDDDLFHRVLDDYQSAAERPQLRGWIERIGRLPGAFAHDRPHDRH